MKTNTEENNTFQIDHDRATQKRQKRQTRLSKEKQIHSQETTRKEHKRFQNNETQTEKNVNKRFQENGKPDYDITDDASQTKVKRIFL